MPSYRDLAEGKSTGSGDEIMIKVKVGVRVVVFSVGEFYNSSR